RRRVDQRHQPRRADPRRLRPEAGDRPDQPAASVSGRGSGDDQPRLLADPVEARPSDPDPLTDPSRMTIMRKTSPSLSFACSGAGRLLAVAVAAVLAGAGCAADPLTGDGGMPAGTGGSGGSGGGSGGGAGGGSGGGGGAPVATGLPVPPGPGNVPM